MVIEKSVFDRRARRRHFVDGFLRYPPTPFLEDYST
jgi:hypothetical protein